MSQLTKCFTKIFLVTFGLVFFGHGMRAQISTQVGIGAMYINGDVDPVFDPLNSFHVAIGKNIGNEFRAELKLGFGKTVGLSGTYMESAQNGGGLVESVYSAIENRVWYPNYLSTYAYIDLGVNYVLNTGIDRLRFIGGAGLGLANSNTSVNLLDVDNELKYNIRLPNSTSLDEAKSEINRRYDSSYETKFEEGGITPHLSLQLGVQFKVTRGIYFSVDARYHLTTSDYLDSLKYISATEESGNNDSVSMLTIGFLGYLLADEKKDNVLVK